jgi:hypothetical protein
VFELNPQGSLSLITETAKTQAIAGAAAGAAVGILRSIVFLRRTHLRDGYDLMAEGLTEIGTGAALGVLCGIAATASGVTAAAIFGRGILTVAAPVVASAVASSMAHQRVDRLIRPMSEDFVYGLKRALRDNFLREAVPGAAPR